MKRFVITAPPATRTHLARDWRKINRLSDRRPEGKNVIKADISKMATSLHHQCLDAIVPPAVSVEGPWLRICSEISVLHRVRPAAQRREASVFPTATRHRLYGATRPTTTRLP